MEELTAQLGEFEAIGERYRAVQQEIFDYTIDLGDRPASERAADAIAAIVTGVGR